MPRLPRFWGFSGQHVVHNRHWGDIPVGSNSNETQCAERYLCPNRVPRNHEPRSEKWRNGSDERDLSSPTYFPTLEMSASEQRDSLTSFIHTALSPADATCLLRTNIDRSNRHSSHIYPRRFDLRVSACSRRMMLSDLPHLAWFLQVLTGNTPNSLLLPSRCGLRRQKPAEWAGYSCKNDDGYICRSTEKICLYGEWRESEGFKKMVACCTAPPCSIVFVVHALRNQASRVRIRLLLVSGRKHLRVSPADVSCRERCHSIQFEAWP